MLTASWSVFHNSINVPALTRSARDILPNQQQSISNQQCNPALEDLLHPLTWQGQHITCLSNTKWILQSRCSIWNTLMKSIYGLVLVLQIQQMALSHGSYNSSKGFQSGGMLSSDTYHHLQLVPRFSLLSGMKIDLIYGILISI